MAGDWIKMRVDLADDPAVIGIAADCQLSEDLVVGKLHRFWSWADQQTTNGCAHSATVSWLNARLGVSGFAEAMEKVGWLKVKKGGIEIPKFDRHNGKTAKTRALASKRMKRLRDADSATDAQPDKRLEIRDKNTKKERVLSSESNGYAREFEAFWSAYPRKLAKRTASTVYVRAVSIVMKDRMCSEQEAHALLLNRAESYAFSVEFKEARFTKHPSTWLNGGCWDDEVPESDEERFVKSMAKRREAKERERESQS